MRTITFYKDNRIDQEHQKDVQDIISEFHATEQSKWDMPLERLLLNFMAQAYGSFDELSDADWDALFQSNKNYSKLNSKKQHQ